MSLGRRRTARFGIWTPSKGDYGSIVWRKTRPLQKYGPALKLIKKIDASHFTCLDCFLSFFCRHKVLVYQAEPHQSNQIVPKILHSISICFSVRSEIIVVSTTEGLALRNVCFAKPGIKDGNSECSFSRIVFSLNFKRSSVTIKLSPLSENVEIIN